MRWRAPTRFVGEAEGGPAAGASRRRGGEWRGARFAPAGGEEVARGAPAGWGDEGGKDGVAEGFGGGAGEWFVGVDLFYQFQKHKPWGGREGYLGDAVCLGGNLLGLEVGRG